MAACRAGAGSEQSAHDREGGRYLKLLSFQKKLGAMQRDLQTATTGATFRRIHKETIGAG